MNRKKRKEILAVTLAGIIGLSPSLAVFGSQEDGDHLEDLYEQEAEALYQEWLRAFEKDMRQRMKRKMKQRKSQGIGVRMRKQVSPRFPKWKQRCFL